MQRWKLIIKMCIKRCETLLFIRLCIYLKCLSILLSQLQECATKATNFYSVQFGFSFHNMHNRIRTKAVLGLIYLSDVSGICRRLLIFNCITSFTSFFWPFSKLFDFILCNISIAEEKTVANSPNNDSLHDGC